jgi:hypothetical protein
MLNVADTKAAPWHKPDLLTHGIPLERIKGLHRAEQYSLDESAARCERETKEKYSHEEIFGKWCNVNAFIDVPVDFAFAYVANIFSLEEWTYNVRDLKHLTNGVYKGRALHTNTELFQGCAIILGCAEPSIIAAHFPSTTPRPLAGEARERVEKHKRYFLSTRIPYVFVSPPSPRALSRKRARERGA